MIPARARTVARIVALGILAVALIASCSSSAAKKKSPSTAASSGAASTSSGAAAPPAPASGAGGTSSSAAATAPAADAAGLGYYLSVGDSLAFGYQQALFDQLTKAGDYSPAKFDFGYSNLIAARLKQANPKIATENLGCPGETTTSYLQGGCGYKRALHVPYKGAQNAAALAYLATHKGPGLITVALGANDLNATIASCGGINLTCITPKLTPVFAKATANLTTILTALRKAAPQATIVLLQLYDPYAVDSPIADVAAESLNTQLATAAKVADARLADAFAVFNPSGAAEKPTLCRLTAYCTSLRDIHPTKAGYQELAKLYLTAAGLPAS